MLTKLGKYEIKGELGKGAMGVVYLAQDVNLGRPAALKVMSSSLVTDQELLKRFYREAVSAGKLSHPNIVTIYDIDQEDGVPYIAMEFLEGDTLQQVIKERRDLSTVRRLDIMTQVSKGLHFAHQNGVIHRDVKPSNILVLKNGQVKIVDFGIAHVEDTSLTQPGCVIGTPYYMSPEQVRGETVDGRSDIFSLGVILYELFALKNPFAGRDLPSVLNRICHVTPEPLAQLMPGCPPELDKIIQKATTKGREERYQSAEDLFFDLLHLGGSLKRSAVEEQVQQGQRLYRAGDLPSAEESLRKALAIDSSHNLARALLREVQERIRSQQRAERVLVLLSRAEEASKARRDEECLKLAVEALALEPENEGAQRYQREASERIERERSIKNRLAQAGVSLRNGDLEAARQELAEAFKLDPDSVEALRLAESVTLEAARRQRIREVEEVLVSARALWAAKDFSASLKALERAGELDPESAQVQALRTLVHEEAARDEANKLEAARQEAIEEVRSLIQRGRYSAAIEQLERTAASAGQSAELTALLDSAREEERKTNYVQDALNQARALLQEGEYEKAANLLRQTQEQFPSADIEAILTNVRDGQARLEKQEKESRRVGGVAAIGEASRAPAVVEAAAIGYFEEFERLEVQDLPRAQCATMVLDGNNLGPSSVAAELDLVGHHRSSSTLEGVRGQLDEAPDQRAAAVPSGSFSREPATTRFTAILAAAVGLRIRTRLIIALAFLGAIALGWSLVAHHLAKSATALHRFAPEVVSTSGSPEPPVVASLQQTATVKRPVTPIVPRRHSPAAGVAPPLVRNAPAPKFGQLTVTSDVNGAHVVMDGQGDPSWITPYTFDKLTPGAHHVGVLMPGHPNTYGDVAVEAGVSKIFNLPMQVPTGFVNVKTDPPGVRVFMDGKPFGVSPVQKSLAVGSHVCRVELPSGVQSWSFLLAEGALADLPFPMKGAQNAGPARGTVEIQTIPIGATIFVDGTRVGISNRVLNLAAGTHEVTLSLPGCPPYQQTIDVPAGKSAPAIGKRLDCQ